MQHFFSSAPPLFWGCDVDASAVEWMRRHYDGTRFFVNRSVPPLPLAPETMGLVYAVSIFTHLSQAQTFAWLEETARVLKPGGVALLTIQGSWALRQFLDGTLYVPPNMKARLRAKAPLQEDALVFEPYEDFVPNTTQYPGIQESYGLTFMGHGLVKNTWTRWFDVLGVDTGTVDGLQDVVVLKKRGGGP